MGSVLILHVFIPKSEAPDARVGRCGYLSTGERSEDDVRINGEHPYIVLCMMRAR